MNFRGSSEPEVVALDDDEMIEAVEELASELETFAFERERVLAKLDIRAAAAARRTARELRLIAERMPEARDPAAREVGFEQLAGLLGRAHGLLEGERHDAPGRPAEGDPPMPSSRDAKTTPPPISDVRDNSRDEFELDYDQLGATRPGDAGENPELVAILRGTHPNHRPTAPALAAVSAEAIAASAGGSDHDSDAVSAGGVHDALTESTRHLPYFGDDDGENDFDDETVAKKVAWQRSGNRVLGG